ncbi:putative ABC-type phosphate transporter [Helianthus anomalus]
MATTAITSKSTASFSNMSNTHFKKPLFVFHNNIKQKRGNLSLQGGGLRNREAAVERETIKIFGLVRCTSEGIERGMLGRGHDCNFVMHERLKVVALIGCVMCLCNADRVVMSVAVVPLAAKHGWNSSFLGIVQVVFSNNETTVAFVLGNDGRWVWVVVAFERGGGGGRRG